MTRRLQRAIRSSRLFLRVGCLALLLLAVLAALVLPSAWRAAQRQQPTLEQPEDPFATQPHQFVNPAVAPWAAKRPSAELLIPRRIHHYFSTSADIPVRLVQEVNSWSNNHRNFEIYFWNAAYVERTLLTRPGYEKYAAYYWNGTSIPYERDLIARLVILHQYGGVSPELNMRSLHDVSDYLTDATCVVAQDRIEKAVFALGLEAMPSLSVLACRPQHHFLAYLLRKVTEVSFRTGAVVMKVATARFVVHAFNAAVAAYDEDCGAGRVSCDFRERVSLAEPHVFMPVMEAGLFDSLLSNCKSRKKMPFLQKEACFNLDVNGNQPSQTSLAMPVYVEAWWPNKDRPALPLVKIGPSASGRKPIKHWIFAGSG